MNWLKILLGVSAILIAGCAAYFSVTGLAVLFSGASVSVIIMASSLEFAKLVSATYLKQEWDNIKGINKWYLTIAVTILMLITSAGIFGFLSNAFQQQNIKLQQVEREVSIWDGRLKSNDQQISVLTKQVEDLQVNQGKIIDKGNVNRSLLRSVDNRDKQIQTIQNKISSLQDSSILYTQKINEIKTNNIDIEREVGGFRFVAESFNLSLNTVVKFFIILIVFVFDPLAIALVIAFNQLLVDKKKDETPESETNLKEFVDETTRAHITNDDLDKLEKHLSKHVKYDTPTLQTEVVSENNKTINNNSNDENIIEDIFDEKKK